jgi:hypothetical protein
LLTDEIMNPQGIRVIDWSSKQLNVGPAFGLGAIVNILEPSNDSPLARYAARHDLQHHAAAEHFGAGFDTITAIRGQLDEDVAF